MSCYNYRSMPADFEEHVEERIDDLMKRYHATSATIMRWRDLCGFSRPRGRPWRAVIRRDIFGAEQIFPSIGEAARCTKGGSPSKICAALHRGGKSCGYYWRYAETRGADHGAGSADAVRG